MYHHDVLESRRSFNDDRVGPGEISICALYFLYSVFYFHYCNLSYVFLDLVFPQGFFVFCICIIAMHLSAAGPFMMIELVLVKFSIFVLQEICIFDLVFPPFLCILYLYYCDALECNWSVHDDRVGPG